MARQEPGSSPVILEDRPTSVPVTRCSRSVVLTPTFGGLGAGRVLHKVSNCSEPMYSVPVMARQEPGSLPLTRWLRST